MADNPAAGTAVALSAIVCTYNRCAKLERSLRAIEASAAQAGIAAEVVVVDNNSRDGTEAVVRTFAGRAIVPVRYVLETAQGLSFARNRGLREARGAICAFTDDDCIVDADWIGQVVRAFAVNTDAAIVGGRVDLFASEDRPVSIRSRGERVRYETLGQVFDCVMGCNMAIRRAAVDRVGRFDPALGGARGVTADDVDFIYRAHRRGLGVLYVPEIRVRHDHGRRTDEAVRVLGRGYVRGRGAFYAKHVLRDRAVLKEAYWEVRRCLAEPGAAGLRDLAAGGLHLVLVRAGLRRP